MPIRLDGRMPLFMHEYKLPSREIVSLHRHDCMEFGVCLDGEGVFIVEGKILTFRKGDCTLIGKNESHLATSAPGTNASWLWFYLDVEKLLRPNFPALDLTFMKKLSGRNFSNVLESGDFPGGYSLLVSLYHAATEEEKIAYVLLFIQKLREFYFDFQPEDPGGQEKFARIGEAVAYLGKHYAEPVVMTAIARKCGMSTTNFRRVFLKETGYAPLDYLHRLRISMAKAELLSGRYAMAEIAQHCGYSSISSFNRQFRKQEHCSPRDYYNRRILS